MEKEEPSFSLLVNQHLGEVCLLKKLTYSPLRVLTIIIL